MSEEANIHSMLQEQRVFEPPAEFAAKAHVKSLEEYEALWQRGKDDPEGFWSEYASELHWFQKWSKVHEADGPFVKWFVDGKTNIAYNCLDRHLDGPGKDKTALIFEGEPGDERRFTYAELHAEVCKFANVLKGLGVATGDRVALYMPMIPELPIAMLACARIGAPHSIVFGGFAPEALAARIQDAGAKVLVTADGGWRRGKVIPLKVNADAAAQKCDTIEKVVVYKRVGNDVEWTDGRDVWWHDVMADASTDCPAEPLDAEHPLFILYTSGTTGKPKGVVHTTGGYMTGVYLTTKWVFDLKDEDIYWCTADIGWVTGHSYIVYGPLANGATTLMFEGAPNHPEPDRLWEIVEKYKVSIFYTAPTAIRAFIKWGNEWVEKHDLSSLRLLGTVGEPINPEAWMWYREKIGGNRCPIVDTWWQTETGMILITPLPGAIPTTPGTATRPFPGVVADVVTKSGDPVPPDAGGYLVLRHSWPAQLRTLWGDDERYKQAYYAEIEGMYFAGDGARKDANGNFWIMGRVDDVLNVSGHRLSTMEIESALVSHPAVAEAAVVGRPHDLKGQAISAFVTVEGSVTPSDELRDELRKHVAKEIGALARPDDLRFTDTLPKTRSGKIMRRLLRDIAAGKETVGDTTTLEDYSVLAKLRDSDE